MVDDTEAAGDEQAGDAEVALELLLQVKIRARTGPSMVTPPARVRPAKQCWSWRGSTVSCRCTPSPPPQLHGAYDVIGRVARVQTLWKKSPPKPLMKNSLSLEAERLTTSRVAPMPKAMLAWRTVKEFTLSTPCE